jgi:hypothetical protein
MPFISFHFKEDFTGCRIRLPIEKPGDTWTVTGYTMDKLVLIHDEDLHLEPGRAQRRIHLPVPQLKGLMAEGKATILSKPRTQPTSFTIFGHKSEAGFEPNDDELEELERLDMTMLENRNTNESWFGKVLRGDESAKEMAAIKHILNVECNMKGFPLETYHVDFLQKTS